METIDAAKSASVVAERCCENEKGVDLTTRPLMNVRRNKAEQRTSSVYSKID
jgi:hypothetical protein